LKGHRSPAKVRVRGTPSPSQFQPGRRRTHCRVASGQALTVSRALTSHQLAFPPRQSTPAPSGRRSSDDRKTPARRKTMTAVAGPTQSRLLTVTEAADELNVTERFIRKLIAEGNLDAVRVGTRLVRIRRTDLEALLHPVLSPQQRG
jgi:excisionase family DNA binding protein